MISLLEQIEHFSAYNSKVVPISIARNPQRDQRIYLLLVINDSEAIAFNRAGRKVAILSQDDISEFFERNMRNRIKVDGGMVIKTEEGELSGVGHFFDAANN